MFNKDIMSSYNKLYLTVYRAKASPYRALIFPLIQSRWDIVDLKNLLIMNGFSAAPTDCNAECVLQYLVQYVGRQSLPMYVFDTGDHIVMRAPTAVVNNSRVDLGNPFEVKKISNVDPISVFNTFTSAWKECQQKDRRLFQSFPSLGMKQEDLERKEQKIVMLEKKVKELTEDLNYSDSGRKKKQYQEANMMIMRAASDVNQMQNKLEQEKTKYETVKAELQQVKAKYDLVNDELSKIRSTIGDDWQDHVRKLAECHKKVKHQETTLETLLSKLSKT